ncbi:hypothetical protein V1525DRAFT_413360, partial [Lipomyces kononenkoae]
MFIEWIARIWHMDTGLVRALMVFYYVSLLSFVSGSWFDYLLGVYKANTILLLLSIILFIISVSIGWIWVYWGLCLFCRCLLFLITNVGSTAVVIVDTGSSVCGFMTL